MLLLLYPLNRLYVDDRAPILKALSLQPESVNINPVTILEARVWPSPLSACSFGRPRLYNSYVPCLIGVWIRHITDTTIVTISAPHRRRYLRNAASESGHVIDYEHWQMPLGQTKSRNNLLPFKLSMVINGG